MFKKTVSALALSASFVMAGLGSASAQYATQAAYNNGSNMGGGFIEFLFGGPPRSSRPIISRISLRNMRRSRIRRRISGGRCIRRSASRATRRLQPDERAVDPKFAKQMVAYSGRETAGTIIIDTPSKFLYLVQDDGRALRYGIGVGRPGFTWSGVKTISMKKEWPSWTPPAEMLKRRPDLPRFMEGGPENPLGARAMYLGSSLYRIHGSNEPWTIGTQVSSGCIRMRNEDVIDLYNRVRIGTRVVVI